MKKNISEIQVITTLGSGTSAINFYCKSIADIQNVLSHIERLKQKSIP